MLHSVVIGPRNSGKSVWAIEWLLEAQPDEARVLLTYTFEEARRLDETTRHFKLPVDGWQIQCVEELARNLSRLAVVAKGRHLMFASDELDLCLGRMLRVEINAGTLSSEIVVEPQRGWSDLRSTYGYLGSVPPQIGTGKD